MDLHEYVSCDDKEDQYWCDQDSSLIIMNESKLIMYDSTNDFVVLKMVSSTDHTVIDDDKRGKPRTWTTAKDEDKVRVMEAEVKNYNSWGSCSSDVKWILTMTKL